MPIFVTACSLSRGGGRLAHFPHSARVGPPTVVGRARPAVLAFNCATITPPRPKSSEKAAVQRTTNDAVAKLESSWNKLDMEQEFELYVKSSVESRPSQKEKAPRKNPARKQTHGKAGHPKPAPAAGAEPDHRQQRRATRKDRAQQQQRATERRTALAQHAAAKDHHRQPQRAGAKDRPQQQRPQQQQQRAPKAGPTPRILQGLPANGYARALALAELGLPALGAALRCAAEGSYDVRDAKHGPMNAALRATWSRVVLQTTAPAL